METRGPDWKNLLILIAVGLILLLMIGCAGPRSNGEPVGWLEVRAEAGAGVSGAESFQAPDGRTMWFGPSRWYPLSHVGRSAGSDGSPTVAFEVAASGREDFRQWTASHVGDRVGVFVEDGLLSVFSVASEMNGSGVIEGSGWDVARCAEVRRALRAHQPPMQGVDTLPAGG